MLNGAVKTSIEIFRGQKEFGKCLRILRIIFACRCFIVLSGCHDHNDNTTFICAKVRYDVKDNIPDMFHVLNTFRMQVAKSVFS